MQMKRPGQPDKGTDMVMRASSITQQNHDFVEEWENIASNQNAIIRLDARGEEKAEVIQGRRTFYLSTAERIITSGKVIDKENDPFKNGAFRPITVPDDVTIETNPNALGDDEILQMFTVADTSWPAVLGTIDSVATLRRMLDLADEADTMTLRRYRTIEDRLLEVRGGPRRLESNDEDLNAFLSDQPAHKRGDRGTRNLTDSGTSNPRRSQGGRSSDYR